MPFAPDGLDGETVRDSTCQFKVFLNVSGIDLRKVSFLGGDPSKKSV